MLAQVSSYIAANFSMIAGLTLEHLRITGTAMTLAVAIAAPLGIALTRVPGLASTVINAVGVLQTIPSLALLAMMIPFLGVGFKPAVAALFLYALLPIVRNTYVGLKQVTPDLLEAARGMGMTRVQVLSRVQIPVALPVIIGGIRTATVICVGTATIAAAIGSGGLGSLIYRGLQQMKMVVIISGALFSALLAVSLDLAIGIVEYALRPGKLRRFLASLGAVRLGKTHNLEVSQ